MRRLSAVLNAPAEIAIGTINKTGALDPWPVAYGLATQSRNKPNEEWWKEMALVKLKEAAGSAAFEQAVGSTRKEESEGGDFIVASTAARMPSTIRVAGMTGRNRS